MKAYELYFKRLVLITLFAIALGALGNFLMDPFQVYHNSYFNPSRYIGDQERYQNAGLIREFWHDEECCTAVMIGTSMSQNYDGEKVGKALKTGPVLNLSMAGASPAEEYSILKRVADIRQPVTVLWEMHTTFNDENESEKAATSGSSKFFPGYLYDNNPLNDYPYLLSASNFSYFLKQSASTDDFYGHKEWFKEHKHSFNEGKKLYADMLPLHRKYFSLHKEKIFDFYAIDTYILPAVSRYKNTKFIFYFPPYSLHSHANADQNSFTRAIEFRKKLVGALEGYPNASVYMFDDLIEATNNLNRYKDPSHYDLGIGDLAIDLIANGRGRLTADNFDARINAMVDRTNAYCSAHKAYCIDY